MMGDGRTVVLLLLLLWAPCVLWATEFFATFTVKLQERYPAAVAAAPVAQAPAPQGLLARLGAWLRKLFGG